MDENSTIGYLTLGESVTLLGGDCGDSRILCKPRVMQILYLCASMNQYHQGNYLHVPSEEYIRSIRRNTLYNT